MPRAFPVPPFFNLPKTITKIDDRSFYHCSLNQNDGIVIGTNMDFFGSNAFLESGLSRVYFLREDQPQEAGRFWHYVDGVPTIW